METAQENNTQLTFSITKEELAIIEKYFEGIVTDLNDFLPILARTAFVHLIKKYESNLALFILDKENLNLLINNEEIRFADDNGSVLVFEEGSKIMVPLLKWKDLSEEEKSNFHPSYSEGKFFYYGTTLVSTLNIKSVAFSDLGINWFMKYGVCDGYLPDFSRDDFLCLVKCYDDDNILIYRVYPELED